MTNNGLDKNCVRSSGIAVILFTEGVKDFPQCLARATLYSFQDFAELVSFSKANRSFRIPKTHFNLSTPNRKLVSFVRKKTE